jgi:hypothetical protein
MRNVTTDDVRTVIWTKKNEGFDAAARELRGVLRRLFDYGMTCGVVQSNPAYALPMRHVFKARSRDRVLVPQEIRAFLRCLA